MSFPDLAIITYRHRTPTDAAPKNKNSPVIELPAHGHQLSPNPSLDSADGNPEVFGDFPVRAPVNDCQKQARAAVWLEMIEHGPQRHAVRNAARWIRDDLFPLADGVQRVILERELPPGFRLHFERRVADYCVNPAPGAAARGIEVFGRPEDLGKGIVDDVLRT